MCGSNVSDTHLNASPLKAKGMCMIVRKILKFHTKGIIRDMHPFQQARISVMQWTTKCLKALFQKKKKIFVPFGYMCCMCTNIQATTRTAGEGQTESRFARKPLPAVNLVLSYATKSLYINFIYSSIFAPKTCRVPSQEQISQ